MRKHPLVAAMALVLPAALLLSPAANAAQDEQNRLLEKVEYYGILKPWVGFDEYNKQTVSQASNRIGARIEEDLNSSMKAYGQYEFAINVVNSNKNTLKIKDDRATTARFNVNGEGSENNQVTTRLGYVAVEHDWFSVLIGKNWSIWYDVAGYADYYPAFGAEAVGVYTAGTDGAATGLGRASNALQLRTAPWDINLGLQFQPRGTRDLPEYSDNDFADTVSASITYNFEFGKEDQFNLEIGGAYHSHLGGEREEENLDYSDDKIFNHAKGAVAGLDFYWTDRVHVGWTIAYLDDIELDNNGWPLPHAVGSELYASWEFTDNWTVFGGYNYLDPKTYDERVYDDATNVFVNTGSTSDFELKYLDIGVSYRFAKSSDLYTEWKLEDSDTTNGQNVTEMRPSTFIVGFLYAWGY